MGSYDAPNQSPTVFLSVRLQSHLSQGVSEGDAGLSVLGSVRLMGPGIINLSFGSLPRHKGDITLKEVYRTGRTEQGRAEL